MTESELERQKVVYTFKWKEQRNLVLSVNGGYLWIYILILRGFIEHPVVRHAPSQHYTSSEQKMP